MYHNKDNANYSISKVVGGLNANVKEGSGRPYDGALFRRLLIEEKWDLIIIHQYSGYSTAYNKWTRKGNDGYLIELLKIIDYWKLLIIEKNSLEMIKKSLLES